MVEGLDNGRRVRNGSPEALRVMAITADCKKKGIPYPTKAVDDFFAYRHFWWGKVAYEEQTFIRLKPVDAARHRPVVLPPEFIIDGEKRLPMETQEQYEQYLAFRELGPDRDFSKFAKTIGVLPHDLRGRAARLRWDERLNAYDARIEVEARKAAEIVLQEQMATEVTRRATYLANEWEVVEGGFAIVKQMMKLPVIRKKSTEVSEDGKTTINVWEPGGWTYSAMAKMVEVLTKVGRLHTGLSTANTTQKFAMDAAGGGERQVNPADEEMYRFANERAEEAYFAALDEWRDSHQTPIMAQIAAGGT